MLYQEKLQAISGKVFDESFWENLLLTRRYLEQEYGLQSTEPEYEKAKNYLELTLSEEGKCDLAAFEEQHKLLGQHQAAHAFKCGLVTAFQNFFAKTNPEKGIRDLVQRHSGLPGHRKEYNACMEKAHQLEEKYSIHKDYILDIDASCEARSDQIELLACYLGYQAGIALLEAVYPSSATNMTSFILTAEYELGYLKRFHD